MATLVLLAACAPSVISTGPTVGEPRLLDNAIIAADGIRLPLRHWLPDGETKAVIVAVHGFNDYSNAFARPAKYLMEHGVAVYAYDQRGFGAAPDRGGWVAETTLTADLAAAARLIAKRYPDKPLYVMGESMGGAVALRTMIRADAPPVAGTILVAPAVWSRAHMNMFERVGLWIGSHAVPWLPVSGKGLDIWPSDNIEMLRDLSRDPLVIKDTRIGTIEGLVDLMDDAYASASALKGPLLILYGERDQVVPPEPSYDVMATVAGRDGVCLAVYGKGYHMLLRDLEAETVLADIVSWIEHPRSALPSGADRRAAAVLAERRPAAMAEAAKP